MIVSIEELSELRRRFKDKKIVLASGVFDLLHRGHAEYLRVAKELGDVLVVMVKSDERVRTSKGPNRPMLPEVDRAVMVDSLKGVNFTFISPHIPFKNVEMDPVYKKVFKALQPDIFYSTNAKWSELERLGIGKIVIAPRPTDEKLRSTTSIIAHVQAKKEQS